MQSCQDELGIKSPQEYLQLWFITMIPTVKLQFSIYRAYSICTAGILLLFGQQGKILQIVLHCGIIRGYETILLQPATMNYFITNYNHNALLRTF